MRRPLLAALAASIMMLCLSLTARSDDRSIVFYTWGGAYLEMQKAVYIDRFERETGIDVIPVVLEENVLSRLRAEQESGLVIGDVVIPTHGQLVRGCDAGYFEPIGHLFDKERLAPGMVHECGVSENIWAFAVAAREESKINGPVDFFDPSVPGKRGMRNSPRFNLELALMADGVAKDQVYEVLKTDEGVDRAFAVLDRIRDKIVWWKFGAQAPQMIADGSVVASTVYTARMMHYVENEGLEGVKLLWNMGMTGISPFTIPKGSSNQENALKFIRFALRTDINQRQVDFFYGPSVAKQPEDVTRNHPTHPDNASKMLPQDGEFWSEHGAYLRERFSHWMING